VKLWDAATGREMLNVACDGRFAMHRITLAFSADGTRLLFSDEMTRPQNMGPWTAPVWDATPRR
jgi:hypothetical protein